MDSRQVTTTRAQKYAKNNKKSSDEKKPVKSNKKRRRYLIGIGIVAILVCFNIGAMIGYGLIDDGNALDIFRLETWTHLYQLIFG
ncbi:MAG: DNA-directed RNA polymerase subunit beta [Vulcanibacillus sp.]